MVPRENICNHIFKFQIFKGIFQINMKSSLKIRKQIYELVNI